jgi:predicted TIM-barrel fold metal-dependent hydrolase
MISIFNQIEIVYISERYNRVIDIKTIPKVDCHAHFFPPGITGALKRQLAGCSAHPDRAMIKTASDPTLEKYLELCQTMQIRASLNLSVANWERTPQQVSKMNDWTRQLMVENPGRVFSLAAINPHNPLETIEAELDRIEDFGFVRGVKLHPVDDVTYMGSRWVFQRFDPIDERWFPLYDLLEKKNWAIYWHCGTVVPNDLTYNATAEKVARINENFPGIVQIAPHLAGWKVEEAIEHLAGKKNIYYDISLVSPWIEGSQAVRRIVDSLGAENIMWGSDFPFMALEQATGDWQQLVSGLTDAEIELVFSQNVKQILNLVV